MHLGIDLIKDPVSKQRATLYAEQIMYDCLEQGVAFKVIEGNILTLRPSLVVTKDDCDFIVHSLDTAFARNKVY